MEKKKSLLEESEKKTSENNENISQERKAGRHLWNYLKALVFQIYREKR